ncbi:chemotaxis protein CheB [Hymenobacter sp. GOD-10R]|uniref:chemotaxis protein CheB n=1 Tax=Hymenobacter sp. GOD-10R TaxID=3093922 RepID=UPI002D78A701|nr:chemotaxis protein CheB [Hymenobacter sp. GOD-10R]WRQ30166.1 chemotaxis protein CheB [Hymenobacter sp. GOD-10R]
MVTPDIIVVGASAGGIPALVELVQMLPPGFPAALFVVQHIPAYVTSYLPDLLSKAGSLPARHPEHGEGVQHGVIYVAPPDHHLLVEQNKVLVTRGPKENRFRPSIDALFRSVAHAYGPRAIGVVLSGYLDDGTSGLWTIQRLGGVTIIQDPEEAYAPAMPRNVLEYVQPDYTVRLAELAPLLIRLTAQPTANLATLTQAEIDRIRVEVRVAHGDSTIDLKLLQQGELTPFFCPECQGPLVQLVEDNLVHFRCRIGHAFSLSALLASVTEGVENQLYQVMQSLEEAQQLLKHLSERFADQPDLAHSLAVQAEQARRRAQAVHESIMKNEALGGSTRSQHS